MSDDDGSSSSGSSEGSSDSPRRPSVQEHSRSDRSDSDSDDGSEPEVTSALREPAEIEYVDEDMDIDVEDEDIVDGPVAEDGYEADDEFEPVEPMDEGDDYVPAGDVVEWDLAPELDDGAIGGAAQPMPWIPEGPQWHPPGWHLLQQEQIAEPEFEEEEEPMEEDEEEEPFADEEPEELDLSGPSDDESDED